MTDPEGPQPHGAEPPAAVPVLPYAAPQAGLPLSYATPTAESGGTVAIITSATGPEAELYASVLAEAGIPAQVIDQNTDVMRPYLGGAGVKVIVRRGDAEAAAEVLRLSTSDDLEPADEPGPPAEAGGRSDPSGGVAGEPLEVVARFDSPRLLREAATTLAAARILAHLPRMVARGDKPPGEGKRFLLRVRADEAERARAVLDEAAEDDDEAEARCPKCRSWRVYPVTNGFWASFLAAIGFGPKPEESSGFECLGCGHRDERDAFLHDARH